MASTIVDKNTGSLWKLISLANMRILSCGVLILIRTRVAVSVDFLSGEVPSFLSLNLLNLNHLGNHVILLYGQLGAPLAHLSPA